jgi:hypothetical protein
MVVHGAAPLTLADGQRRPTANVAAKLASTRFRYAAKATQRTGYGLAALGSRNRGVCIVNRTPVIERAFELARSGRFRIPSEVRKALISDRYTQAELFQLEGKATWGQLRTLCTVSYHRA